MEQHTLIRAALSYAFLIAAMNILISASNVTIGGVSIVLGRLLLFVFVQHLQLAFGRFVGWVQPHHLGEDSDSFIILM